MPLSNLLAVYAARFFRSRVPAPAALLAVLVVAAIGWTYAQRPRHAAVAVVLQGTVTWSNQETRLIAFETDGVVRRPNDGDTMVEVVTDDWQDAHGTHHSGGSYPACLASEDPESPVSSDRHRVELAVIDWDTGGVMPVHVAVRVRCLD